MAHKVKLTFQLKRGTAARWLELNPVLADGEPGFELDTNKLKIGDGVHAWSDLVYITDAASLVTDEELQNAIDIAKEEILNQSGLYVLDYNKEANEIQLINQNTGETSKISTLDFIKDGMIDKVELSTDKKFLNIIWNTDAGKQTTSVPMESFIDKYIGQNTDTINLAINNNIVSAQIKAEVLTNSHLAPNANIETSKLSLDARAKLDKANTAVQPEALEAYAQVQDTNEKFNRLEQSVDNASTNGRNYTDEKVEELNNVIDSIDNTIQAHDTQLKQDLYPTLGQHSEALDRLAGSVSYVNCLKHYNPELIRMEYTNKAGGWKASIKDNLTGEEIHGASLFSRHQKEGWDEHNVEFINQGTTDATFQIYSVAKEPGVIQVDDIKIENLSANGLYYDTQCCPSDFDVMSGFWTWPATWVCHPDNNQAIISATSPTWSGYVTSSLLQTLEPGGAYYVDIGIVSCTSGGVNFSIKDGNGTKLNLMDINGKKRTGKYLSTIGTTRLYFIAPSENTGITLHFGGSGDQIDNLIIGSCVIYQSNSTQWASTSPILDNAWTQPEDWYTWGKEVDYESKRVMHFSTSEEKKYWYTKQRALTLDQYTHYRLSFRARCFSGGLNVSLKDENNKHVTGCTVSLDATPEWANFETSFVPTTKNCTLSIQAFGDQTLLYDVYLSDLVLTPIQPTETILVNGDFNNDKYVGGSYYVSRANWTFGGASSVVDGTAQLAVSPNNSLTYVPGCSQTITLVPGNKYRISFRSKSISHEPMWMPYITFTNEDKTAFVSDIYEMNYEYLKFGGPWIQNAAEHYACRIKIIGDTPIAAKFLSFWGQIDSSNEFEVSIKISDGEEVIYAQTHQLRRKATTIASKYIIPLPEDFLFTNSHQITVTFMVNEIQSIDGINQIYNIALLGEHYVFTNMATAENYKVDANGKIYIKDLQANRIVANIDDGSLDWEV